jgi:hypothetical protein
LAIQIPAPLRRLANFAKSIWPADPAFAALLLGSILLLISQRLGSWSSWVQVLLHASADSRFVGFEAAGFLNLTMFLAYIAGAAALFVCFFPGPNPSKRLVRWVYIPLAVGLAANVATAVFLSRSHPLVPLPDGEPLTLTASGLSRLVHAVGSGIWSALLGAVLVLYADLRLRSGFAQLPVHFSPEFSARSDDAFADRQVNRFTWMMIALAFLTGFAAFPAYYFPYWIHGVMVHGEPGWKLSWSLNYINVQVWGAIALFALVYLAMGASRRESLKQSLRLPPAMYLGLGVLLPTIVSALLPMLQYTFARMQWAAYDFHRFEPAGLFELLRGPAAVALSVFGVWSFGGGNRVAWLPTAPSDFALWLIPRDFPARHCVGSFSSSIRFHLEDVATSYSDAHVGAVFGLSLLGFCLIVAHASF